MAETLTQKWLRQNVQPYVHPERVFADIDATLTRFPTLRPKTDAYTYDDGRTQLLLCLHNVIPISYRGASYNIPVAIWIPRDHPAQPPIVYVVPTSDMLVKAGKSVEVSGRCSLEYMQHWQRKSESCSLSALVEAMQDQFSREPPVYAKPKEPPRPPAPAQSSGSQPGYASRPPPLLPTSSTSASGSPQPLQHPERPLLPPKPGHYSATTSPSPPNSVGFQQPHVRPSLPPPELPRSPNAPSNPILPPSSPTQHQYHGHDPRSLGHPPPPPPVFTSPPPWSARGPPPQPWVAPAPAIPLPNLLDGDTTLLRLHSQVHEKLTSEMASLAQALALDAERLRAQQSDLLLGEPAIRDEMARLEAVRDVCHNVSSRMRSTVDQAERSMSELRRKGDPEVDELVCSTTIVHNQLINLVAEDNAIEDTIYHLHRALNSGRIDLERFLRSTRILAEEQFMKRALIEKIESGLPMGASWT
ncbi:UEV-domain-containing protein [Hymenopellis radicata]|nr:UEV-domain-containing protein [Hymenopellis radicata]